MSELNYKKLDKIIDELQEDGSHVFIGEIAEYLINHGVRSVKEVRYIAEVIGFSTTQLMVEIRARKNRPVAKLALGTYKTGKF